MAGASLSQGLWQARNFHKIKRKACGKRGTFECQLQTSWQAQRCRMAMCKFCGGAALSQGQAQISRQAQIRLGPKGAFSLPQPPQPPPPMSAGPKSCPAALKFSGLAPWSIFCRKCACFFDLKSMTSCWPGLSDVSETRLSQQLATQPVYETGLAHPAQPVVRLPGSPGQPLGRPAGSAQRPETSLRPSPSARLLRVCDFRPSPASNSPPASGPSVYETGLAHPATRPSTAQPSPPSPSSRVVRLPSSQQPTHGFAASWLRLASGPAQPATTSAQPAPRRFSAHASH